MTYLHARHTHDIAANSEATKTLAANFNAELKALRELVRSGTLAHELLVERVEQQCW